MISTIKKEPGMVTEVEGFSIGSARPASLDLERVGIRTEYAGVSFRSRLEAKWAAMFSQLRWKWEYEPTDLSGYVPDFVVQFARGPMLVEVKPAVAYPELEPNARKLCRSGWRGDFLLVGAILFDSAGCVSFGTYGMWDRESQDGWHPADHAEAIDCSVCGLTAFRHASAGWECASCGCTDRKRSTGQLADRDGLARAWAAAGNAVQWRGNGASEGC